MLLEYHHPEDKLESFIHRMNSLGFKYMFEPGYNGSEENGTIFFYI